MCQQTLNLYFLVRGEQKFLFWSERENCLEMIDKSLETAKCGKQSYFLRVFQIWLMRIKT